MKKFAFPRLFLIYLVVIMSYFLYAGFTGLRILGDDTEKYDPTGPERSGNNRVRGHRFYHK